MLSSGWHFQKLQNVTLSCVTTHELTCCIALHKIINVTLQNVIVQLRLLFSKFIYLQTLRHASVYIRKNKNKQTNKTLTGVVQISGREASWNTQGRLINLTSEWHITHAHTSLLHQHGGQTKNLLALTPTPSRGFSFREISWCEGHRSAGIGKNPSKAKAPIKWQRKKRGERYRETDQRVKLAAVETKCLSEEGKASMDRGKKGVKGPGSRDSPKGKTVLVELAWDIPMSMALPIQVKTDQPFSFLDTTPAGPGIRE